MIQLPNEILSFIIQQIDRQDLFTCTLVNRYFYTYTVPILWYFYRDYDYLESSTFLHDLVLATQQSPHQQHPMLTHVRTLELYAHWTDTDFIRFMSLVNPNVDQFYLWNGVGLTDQSLLRFPQRWAHLTHIQLTEVSVTRATTTAIAQHCQQLEHLALLQCTLTTPDIMQPFLPTIITTTATTHPTPLHQLLLYSEMMSSSLNYQALLLDAAKLPLTEFGLSSNYPLHIIGDFLASHLHHHSSSCCCCYWPQLTTIRLSCCYEPVHDEQLVPFLKLHPMLTRVIITDTVNITDATLQAMTMYLPHLVSVDVDRTRVTARGVMHLLCHCLHLCAVSVSGCNIKVLAFLDDTIDDEKCIDGNVISLSLNAIHAIRKFCLHGDQDDEDDDDIDYDGDDDDDQIWLRIWERSFTNFRFYGSSFI